MAFTSILNFPFLFPLLLIPFPQSAITQEASTSTRESPHESMMRLAPAQVLEGVPQLDDQEYKSPLPMAMQAGTVWPLPQKLHYGSQNRTLRSGSVQLLFRGGQRDVDCDILEHAKNTYLKKWLFSSAVDQQVPQPNSVGTGVQLVVKLRKKCPGTGQFPTAEMNEEYRLTVPLAGEAVLEADEIWGILRGLETFSQLIFQQRGQLFMRTATIHDWPEYPVRGILLDSSRHFLHKNLLLRQIDLLAQNKMNVLHWHIVDMESFPYMSTRFPNMSTQGAFSPKHTYSPETVREVVQHARLRGVRVVPEFDTPGHMASWKGSGILAECRDNKGKLVPSSMLDPSRESTFAFLKEFLKEVVDTFPDQYLHLGGDETAYWTQQCWAYNPQIRAFMAQKGFANITQLENFYFSKLQAIVKEVFGEDSGRRMIFWQEVFDHNQPDRTAIVHNWYSHNAAERSRDIKRAVQRGFQVLVSSCWYLNLINYGADWRQKGPAGGEFYQCDPRGFEGTYAEKQLVIGGVATMWGEFVDGTNVEATLWPRASAVAERLWSPPEFTKSAEVAWPRLQEHRCRMIARGYRAEPVNGSDFCLSAWADQPVE